MLRNWNTNTHTTPPYNIDLNTDTAPHPHYIFTLLHVLAYIPRLFHSYSDTKSYGAK